MNWIYFLSVGQMTPQKVWLCTAQGCNHQFLQSWCSAVLVPKFLTLWWRRKVQVGLETRIELHEKLYYLGLEPVCHRRKAKVLLLDHPCLLEVFMLVRFCSWTNNYEERAVGFDRRFSTNSMHWCSDTVQSDTISLAEYHWYQQISVIKSLGSQSWFWLINSLYITFSRL